MRSFIKDFKSDLLNGHKSYIIYDKTGDIVEMKLDNTENITSFVDIPYIDTLSFINFDLTGITDGTEAFKDNSTLITWEGSLENMTTAESMFNNSCLTSFKGSLRSLVNGSSMFYTQYDSGGNTDSNFQFDELIFETDSLESLENGDYMFHEKYLILEDNCWRNDMPNLKSGYRMFYFSDNYPNEKEMRHFIGDLSSLVNGSEMFCGSNLKSIRTKLTKLEQAGGMFSNCWFDGDSVKHLVQELMNNESEKDSSITIGVSMDLIENEDFWNETGYPMPSENGDEWFSTLYVTNIKGKTWEIWFYGRKGWR